jgi:hypothetical protein
MTVGRATKRAIGPSGTVAGACDENLCLNTIICKVEFSDGQSKEHAANVIAKNMSTQVDFHDFSLTMMEAMTCCQKDEAAAVPKIDKHLTTTSGQKKLRKTTVGWWLLTKWANGSESWIPLKDLKESHPRTKTAEFAEAQSMADEPAFAWWKAWHRPL